MAKRNCWQLVVWLALAASPLTGTATLARAGEPEQAGGKAADFDRTFTQWKSILSELRTLRSEYRQAEPGRREAIEKRYGELVAQGEATLPKLIQAAEAAYAEAPAQAKPQADFLLGIVASMCANDDYENALRIAKVLINNNHPDKVVYAWGGVAAFCTGDFDLAETYFKEAREGAVLSRMGDQFGQLVPKWVKDIPYYKDAWRKEQALRQAEAKEQLPRVLIKTTKGEIEVELFENEAPMAVANFITLVEKGFYNGTPFHRVLEHFMAQGGDPTGTGGGGPGYSIPCECYQANHRIHFRGTLSMAHAGRDTGGSQFFLTFVPTQHLDGKHTVFGRVVKGFEVLAKLQRRSPDAGEDGPAPDKIVEAKVLSKRAHPYEFKKLPDPRSGR